MDEFHNRDDWPFVAVRKVSEETAIPVSPSFNEERETNGGAEEDEEAISELGDEAINISSESDGIDDLYEDSDEGRDVATPMPTGVVNGDGDHSDPYEMQHANGRTTPTMNMQTRPSSIIKGTPPSRTLPRRTPSITAQIPLNRQRVRYSWQSVHDEEPNRPRIHVIKLVSNTATASAGFPQGEAFGFSISPCGRRIAAYNSARLYILQSQALPVGISQDYALKRRPLAVEIVDEGNTLAILADEHTVNIYDLEQQMLRRVKTIKLDFPTSCIALASTGGLLAAGYEGGVEIFSLDADALPTDRRAVRSQKMDHLMFSKDGSTLIGTTTRINASSTVVVAVPIFPTSPSGIPTHEELKEAWCSELLNPENIRNSSHATFMRENRQTCNDRLFAWNGLQDTFGILRVPDMMYSNLDFPVVINPPLSTLGGLGAAIHSCPDVDEHGEAVAMVVNDRTIRLYLVPKNIETTETIVEAHSIDHELDEGYGCPFSDLRWVQSGTSLPAPTDNGTKQVRGRLIVTSPGAVIEADMSEELAEVEDLEGGRIIMFDFDPQYIGQPGQTYSLTLGNSPPQLLEEPQFDVAHEVAIIRRRTVNQSKTGTLSQRPATLGRSATSSGSRGDRAPRPGAPTVTPNVVRRSMIVLQSEATRSLPDLLESSEAMDTFEEPYAQNAPRSHSSLQRAASNAQRHRFQTIEERNQESVSAETTGNFLPLPEYTEEPNAPLPSRFRAMAGLDVPGPPPVKKPAIVTTSNGDRMSPASSTPSTAPAGLAESFSAEQACVAANNTPRSAESRQETRRATPPQASPGAASVTFAPVSRSDTSSSITAPVRTDTMQSLAPMNPRFLQRAYANASVNPLAVGTPTRQHRDWENVSPVPFQQPERPPTQRNMSLPIERATRNIDTARQQEPWDAISPLRETSPSSPSYSRPSLAGSQYRFSTSQLNPPGHSPPHHINHVSPSRAPSSAGSWAPSSISTNAPSYREQRLPPHMQAFRNAAAAGASATIFPPPSPLDSESGRGTPKPSNGVPGGYPITGWHPPAPSSVPSGGHVRRTSLSSRSAFASTTKAKNLGFFRGSKRKNHNLLFGPEFASKQPGANSPPGTAKSDESVQGAKSMFDTKSIFTFKTRSGAAKCVVM